MKISVVPIGLLIYLNASNADEALMQICSHIIFSKMPNFFKIVEILLAQSNCESTGIYEGPDP